MNASAGMDAKVPQVIFEDDDILVIDKPVGLIVHSDGRTEESSVSEWVVSKYPEMKGVGEHWVSPQGAVIDRPGIVHRLDRTTSGVMVIARNEDSFSRIKEQFQKRLVEKTYLAYVYGHPKEEHGVIEAEIGRTRSDPPRWSAEFRPKGTKRTAVTEWKILKRGIDSTTGEKVSLLEVSPKTGRTHQIRVHLKAIGNPVVSDHLYAPKKPLLLSFDRPALHASSLTIMLASGERKMFTAPPPEDFQKAEKLFA